MILKTFGVFTVAMLAAMTVAAQPPTPSNPAGNDSDVKPNGRRNYPINHPDLPDRSARPGGDAGASGNGIYYHGGPVMLGVVHAYYIWYGGWSTNTAVGILSDLVSGLSSSPYYNINTTYYNGSNQHVSNLVTLTGTTTDSYSRGTSLTDANIQSVVADAINSGRLPKDTNGVYFVLTSSDVTATSGFCTQYCGWHTHATIGGTDIKYAFIGNAERCPAACSDVTSGSTPNGNLGADAMASIIAHELEEAATDPDLNAWYDRRGYENADKCAWTFGTTYKTSNGATANMKLGARDFLIQQNWVNANGGLCAVKFP